MPTLVFSFYIFCLFALSQCGPSAFVKGDYDDVQRTNLLNDSWSESDMQAVVNKLVGQMLAHPAVANSRTPPLVIVTTLQNKTSEHIDTQSIMDMVRVDLSNSGKVQFVDKEARGDIQTEYDFQNSGAVSQETKKSAGGQIGADFIVNGRIDSIVQEVGKEKTVYYKITLNLTNLKTSVISWTGYSQIRKAFKKKTVGF